MTFDKYKSLTGEEFIDASAQHPELLEQLRADRRQTLLDESQLRFSIEHVLEYNGGHHNDKVFKEQVRALFVAFCIVYDVLPYTDDFYAVLNKFVDAYKPEDVKQFKKYMCEYADADYYWEE